MTCGVNSSRLIIHQVASSSRKSNLSSLPPPPPWLVELHSKLWGKRDLFDEIFRTVTLTQNDFIELQQQLHSHDPERNSDSSESKDVTTIKAGFLRSKSTADPTAFAHFDATPNGNLAPKLVFDTTCDVTPPIPSEDTAAIDSSEHVDAMNVDLDYIEKDSLYLSTGGTAIFPCTFRFMDLTVLGLTHFIRTPQLMLLRNEWGNMLDIFNKRERGIRGSAVFTGQPGIGKCYY
jgi:hypothetical protein